MSEEYLARHDSEFFWLMVVFGIMFVILLSGFIFAWRKEPDERIVYRKKFVWAAVIVFAGHLFLSVPYTGHFYRFGEQPKVPDLIASDDEARKHILDHSQRIHRLEQELEEARVEVRELRDHYQRLLQVLMVAVFVIGFGQIMKKPQGEPDPKSALNLND